MTQPQYMTLSEAHFVGREEEVALLTGMLDEAKHGRGGAILFVGEAGIGKTRLLSEIMQISSLRNTTLVTAQCQPTSADKPVGLLADLVTALRAAPGSLGASVESLSLLQRLTEYTQPAAASGFDEAGGSGAAIRRAVFDLFEAVAEENMLLVTIEDIHWADAFSWRIVRTLAEATPRRPVLMVATARRAQPPTQSSGDVADYHPFHVRPLPRLRATAAQALVTRLIADYGSEIPDDMLDWCVSVAEGNPYYLRELLLRWLETQEPFGVPQSLVELINRRLNRLSPDALRVFHACVAMGNSCTVALLERVEATEPAQLVRALEELSLDGVIASDAGQIVPKHDLLAQAARDRLTPALKALIHRRIATILEAESRDNPIATDLWDCAHHWEMAGDSQRAISFLIECGQHLTSVGLPEEAAALYRKAMGLQATDHVQRLQLHEGLVRALRQCGLLEQVLTEIANLRRSARAHGHALALHSDLELLEYEAWWRTDRANEQMLLRLESCVRSTDASPSHRLNAAFWLLAFAQRSGDSELAHCTWKVMEPLVTNTGIDACSRLQLAMIYHTDYGDLVQAAQIAADLVREARRTSDAMVLLRALRNASLALRRAGHIDESKGLLNEAVDVALQRHAALAAAEAANQLAALALEEGDTSTAASWIGRGDEWISQWESALQATDSVILRARLAIAVGDNQAAAVHAAALPLGIKSERLRQNQVVLSIRLSIALRDGRLDFVEDHLGAAARYYGKLRNRGHQDYAVEVLAQAYQAVGDGATAHDLLQAYLTTHRRDRGPLPPSLIECATALGITTESVTTRKRAS